MNLLIEIERLLSNSKQVRILIAMFTVLFLILPATERYLSVGEIILAGDHSYYNQRVAESIGNRLPQLTDQQYARSLRSLWAVSSDPAFSKASDFAGALTTSEAPVENADSIGRQNSVSNPYGAYDPLVFSERPIIKNPYHYLIYGFGVMLGTKLASLILPFLLGTLTVMFFYLVLQSFNLSIIKQFFIALIFIFSPLFMYTFTTSTSYSLVLMLAVIAFYLFQSTNQKANYFSLAPLFVLSFFGFTAVMLVIISFALYEIAFRKKYRPFLIISFVAFVMVLICNSSYYLNYGFVSPSYYEYPLISHLITDLGSLKGFGFFSVLLFFLGIFSTWDKKYSRVYLLLYLALIFLILLSIFYPSNLVYLNLLVAVFAGKGLFYLTSLKWDQELVRDFSLLIILLGVLFSAVSYTNRLAESYPDMWAIESLEWLKAKGIDGAAVLSHYSNGHIIQAVSGMPVVLDSRQEYMKDYKQVLNDMNTIFNSRSLKTTMSLLDKYHVKYIFIDKRMKEGLVWKRKDDGLLFLFYNSDRFTMVRFTQNNEIWYYR